MLRNHGFLSREDLKLLFILVGKKKYLNEGHMIQELFITYHLMVFVEKLKVLKRWKKVEKEQCLFIFYANI